MAEHPWFCSILKVTCKTGERGKNFTPFNQFALLKKSEFFGFKTSLYASLIGILGRGKIIRAIQPKSYIIDHIYINCYKQYWGNGHNIPIIEID